MTTYIGHNIKKTADELMPIALEDIATQIAGNQKLREDVYRYRRTLQIHADAARHLKSALPYIIAANFKDHFRKMEALIAVHGLFIDLDHLVEHEIQLDAWKQKLSADRRIAMMYVSPGGTGLKLFYLYDKPLTVAREHTRLYKRLCAELEEQYGLLGKIDKTTSDVTRVSFLSHDRDVFYRSDAVKLKTSFYLTDTIETMNLKIDNSMTQNMAKAPQNIIAPEQASQIDYTAILAKLGKKVRSRGSVPNMGSMQLDQRIPAIEGRLQQLGISILTLEDIAYGKKMRITDDHYWAEINLFYGKRGFTVAGVPKKDSYGPLMQVAIGIAEEVLFSISTPVQEIR